MTAVAENGKAATLAALGEVTQAPELIRLEALMIATVEVEISGVTPLIMHKWSEKAKRGMRDIQEVDGKPKARKKLEPKLPKEEAEAATYRLPDGRPGMPATAFRAAIVDAARLFDGVQIVLLKQIIQVQGEGPDQLVPVVGDMTIREDMARNSGRGQNADIRYRPAFYPWSTLLSISFVPSVIDPASIVALVNAAGMGGVGDWRPLSPKSKTGTYGQFQVVA